MERISLAHQTLYAELLQQALDAAFDEQFAENGSFVTKTQKERKYWYYEGYETTSRGRDGAQIFEIRRSAGRSRRSPNGSKPSCPHKNQLQGTALPRHEPSRSRPSDSTCIRRRRCRSALEGWYIPTRGVLVGAYKRTRHMRAFLGCACRPLRS